MKASLSVWEKKKNELLAEMTEATRKVALDFDKKRVQVAHGTVLIHYDMGVRVDEVVGDRASYGEHAVEQLAAFLGMGKGGPSTLYSMRATSKAFTREEIAEQIRTPMGNGKPLTFGHFLAVARVASHEKQLRLLREIRSNNMGVKEIEEKIRAEQAQKRKGQGGRKHKDPATPMSGLTKGVSQAHRLNTYLDVLHDKVFDSLATLAVEEVERPLLERLEAFEREATEIAAKLEKVQQALVPVKDRLAEILAKKAEAQAEDEAEDEAEGESEDTVPVVNKKKAGKAKAKSGAKKVRRRPAPV